MPLSSSESKNFSAIPSVDELLRSAEFAELTNAHGHEAVRDTVRLALTAIRDGLAAGTIVEAAPAAIAARVAHALQALMAPSLKPVFNLTGTILHTNLGRSPLPQSAIDAMVAAAGAVNLEYDLETGKRGQRDAHLEDWLIRLTGAEAAIAVNNNAAAVMIVLNTLARGKEVLVSRGELIEIGGAFRIPDIMERSGCILREVGTTNRTHLADYEKALGPNTALILKVHTSNYQVQGFTKSVAENELSTLARGHDLPFVVDLGSGTLIDLKRFGLPHEPTARETLQNGADLITFSGDKLLGGPQAGMIAGRPDLVHKIATNPMKRAMRLDKITIAALAAVLRLYADPERLALLLPTLALLTRATADIEAQATRLKPHLTNALDGLAGVEIEASQCQIGSGSIPIDLLDGFALVLRPNSTGDKPLRELAHALRSLPRPVIGRVHNGSIILDLRALDNENEFIRQIRNIGGSC